MTLQFVIQKKKLDKDSMAPIHLVYRHGSEEVRVSAQRKVNPDYWNAKSREAWVKESYGAGHVEFNMALKTLRSMYSEKIDRFFIEHKRYPDKDDMRKLFDKSEEAKSFFVLFALYIEHKYKGRGRKSVTEGTKENYDKVVNRMHEYEAYKGIKFSFNHINHAFYDDFIHYLTTQHGNGVNTIGSYIKILKGFLRWCEIHHNVAIHKAVMSGLKTITEDNAYLYLQKEEIEALLRLVLKLGSIYDKVRDAFCLQCFIGCRHSDLRLMVAENIMLEGGKYRLKFKTKKNKKNIDVLLAPQAVLIIEKYRGIDPADWIPGLAECNIYIKKVCEQAQGSFLEKVQIVRGGGDLRKEIIFQKWQLVSTHTAPRSFINIMLNAGVPEHVICTMVGKSARTLDRYKHSDVRDIEKALLVWEKAAVDNTVVPGEPGER